MGHNAAFFARKEHFPILSSFHVLLNIMLFCRPFNIFVFILHYELISFEQLWIHACYLNGETFVRFIFVIYILIILYMGILTIFQII